MKRPPPQPPLGQQSPLPPGDLQGVLGALLDQSTYRSHSFEVFAGKQGEGFTALHRHLGVVMRDPVLAANHPGILRQIDDAFRAAAMTAGENKKRLDDLEIERRLQHELRVLLGVVQTLESLRNTPPIPVRQPPYQPRAANSYGGGPPPEAFGGYRGAPPPPYVPSPEQRMRPMPVPSQPPLRNEQRGPQPAKPFAAYRPKPLQAEAPIEQQTKGPLNGTPLVSPIAESDDHDSEKQESP